MIDPEGPHGPTLPDLPAVAGATAEDGVSPVVLPLVLIADNDRNVAEILRAFLVRQSLEVEIVEDGRAALERIERGGVALLVCDLDMPVMSGDALLEALTRVAACPPIVVVSGYVDSRSAQQLEQHPAVVSILRKPFDVRRFAVDVRARIERTAAPVPGECQNLFGFGSSTASAEPRAAEDRGGASIEE